MIYRDRDYRDNYHPDDRRDNDDLQYQDSRQDPYFDPDADYSEHETRHTRENNSERNYHESSSGLQSNDPYYERERAGFDGYQSHRQYDYDRVDNHAEYEYDTDHTQQQYSTDPYFDSEDQRGFNQLEDSRVDPHIRDDSQQTLTDSITISDRDLRDVDRSVPLTFLGRKIAKTAIVCCFGGFCVMAYLSLRPEISAYDIVSAEQTRQSQQTVVADMEGAQACEKTKTCAGTDSVELAEAEAVNTFQEIPASDTSAIAPAEPDVNAENNSPDIMQVALQWSNVRRSPSISGEIVQSIRSGTKVEILGQSGNWFEINTIDGQEIQGFMHQSTLMR